MSEYFDANVYTKMYMLPVSGMEQYPVYIDTKLFGIQQVSNQFIYFGTFKYDVTNNYLLPLNETPDPHLYSNQNAEVLKSAYNEAKTRYDIITQKIDFHTHADDYYTMRYTEYLKTAVVLRDLEHNRCPIGSEQRAEQCINWLINSSDFFTAPASSQFHENYPHGLVEHTLKVLVKSLELFELPTFRSCNLSLGSVMLNALVHDWCKIGMYETYMRNVKNEETGQWEKVQCYKRSNHLACALGHGEASMYLAQKWFNINYEEAAAIRHHMSAWNVTNDGMSALEQCNETIPYVLLLQFADQLAITDYAFKED